jgi:hypothetical protein
LPRWHPPPPDDDAAVAAPDGDPLTGQHKSVEQAGRLGEADFRALCQRPRAGTGSLINPIAIL